MSRSADFRFMTAAFEDSPEARKERINDTLGGHALSSWLVGELRARKLDASEPFVEDHGWDFGIQAGRSRYLCICLIEDAETAAREGRVGIQLMRSFGDMLTGRNRLLASDDPIVMAVADILGAHPEIGELERAP